MAPSKRSYDLKKNQRTHELVSRLESEVKSMKAPLPTMVPRRDAQRLWGFTEKDLKLLDSSAILSSKRGQRGIYYSELDLRALQDQIDMSSLVEPDMIPEVVIKRQLPMKALNLDMLRLFAIRGKQPRSKGKETFMYMKDEVERCLNVRFVTREMAEYVDYIHQDKVPRMLQLELPDPQYGVKLSGDVYCQAKLCYFGERIVQKILPELNLCTEVEGTSQVSAQEYPCSRRSKNPYRQVCVSKNLNQQVSGSQNSDQQESSPQDPEEQDVFESHNLVHLESGSQYLEKQVSGQNPRGERLVSNEASDLMYGSLGFQAYGELGV